MFCSVSVSQRILKSSSTIISTFIKGQENLKIKTLLERYLLKDYS